MNLPHDLVENFGLILVFKVLVDCAKPGRSLQVLVGFGLLPSSILLFKVGIFTCCSVFYLLDRCDRAIPDGLLILQLP